MEDVLDEATAENACVQSNKKNKTLLGWLIKNESTKADVLAAIAADDYGIPLIDI